MKIHEKYIKRCIELAKNGLGTTSPNPIVGSVIVYNNTIIGEGFTSPYGGNHAEVNAINSVIDKSLLNKAALYVSLEPCSHFGKTPPCSDLIIEHNIPNVIIGCVDSHKVVAGKGIEKLKKHGCNVVTGILEEECVEVNKRFFTHHTKKRPYIILKWAESMDGFISPLLNHPPKGEEAGPVWITNQYSRQLVHKWRGEEQAILVGTSTVINDNPKLDVRDCKGKNPIRIVLDRSLRIPKSYHIYNNGVKTIILTEKEKKGQDNLSFEQIDFSKNLARQICDVLYNHKIQSVLIEGGAQTLQTFIGANLWDEVRIFTGDVTFKTGVKAPTIIGEQSNMKKIQSDVLKVLKNTDC